MANENFADTVDKLKGIFDVTNMISTFGEVALITKKVQTHVKKTKVSFYLKEYVSRYLLRFFYNFPHQTTQYLKLMDRFRGNKKFF